MTPERQALADAIAQLRDAEAERNRLTALHDGRWSARADCRRRIEAARTAIEDAGQQNVALLAKGETPGRDAQRAARLELADAEDELSELEQAERAIADGVARAESRVTMARMAAGDARKAAIEADPAVQRLIAETMATERRLIELHRIAAVTGMDGPARHRAVLRPGAPAFAEWSLIGGGVPTAAETAWREAIAKLAVDPKVKLPALP